MEWQIQMALMDNLRNLWFAFHSVFFTQRADIRLKRPLLSITFDDVPASAFDAGLPVLEQHKCKATFYICGSYTGKTGYLDKRRIQTLIESGHEIGCHSFSHLRTDLALPHKTAEDCEKNRDFAKRHFGYELKNFAYPYGAISLLNKKALSGVYHSLRGVHGGINAGRIDLNLLRANALYGLSTVQIEELFQTAAKAGGWLIFYTHDVSSTPTPHGCTPEQLTDLAKKAAALDFQVVTVEEGLRKIKLG